MVRGSKNKEKMVFAKDKKQAVMAVVVLILFAITASKTAITMYMENQPMAPITETPSTTTPPISTDQSAIDSTGTTSGTSDQDLAQDANNIYSQTTGGQSNLTQNSQMNLITPTSSIGGDIEILTKKRSNGKKVTIAVVDAQRANPFLPASENIPKDTLPYLTPPPDFLGNKTDTGKILSTTISGIMYDKYSPSAIINIEGTDYLVKTGDIINNYKILSINKTHVCVKSGANVYKAGVGELLSQEDLNYNTIANLNKKFGGNNIPIRVKKKKK